MTPVCQSSTSVRSLVPRVLVVDDEPAMIELVGDMLGGQVDCRLSTASTYAEGHRFLQTQAIELLIVDLHLPDGDGAELLATLHKRHPLASAIVITGSPSVEGAVAALRHGAVDFLAKPFTGEDFLRRIRGVLQRQALIVRSEGRIERLRAAVRRLNDARRVVTKKVDLLCNDLVGAYGELSRQLDLVRTTESFRSAIASAADLEQMLCHSMDWVLRQLGYANVAIWLANGEADFQLGAYMKYTIAGDAGLTSAMSHGLLPLVARESLLHLDASQAQGVLSSEELRYLGNQNILAAHCTYLGESLASIVLFRESSKPFSEEDVATLRAIGPIFAVTLATMVRHDPEQEPGEEDMFGDGGATLEDEDGPPNKRRRREKDESDWWKRGESPPF